MAMFRTLFVAFCLFGGAFAHLHHLHDCPNVEPMKDFCISRSMGLWYEASRYTLGNEIGITCSNVHSKIAANNTISLSISHNLFEIKKVVHVEARIPDGCHPSKLRMSYPKKHSVESDYLILGTDYKSYIVVYSCSIKRIINKQLAWIFTRERNPSESVISEALRVVEKKGLTISLFSRVKQCNCEE